MVAENAPVDIEVTFRNVEGEPRVREYALKRLGKVIHSLPKLRKASVEISAQPGAAAAERYVVQTTLAAKGTLMRAEDRGESADVAIDRVHDVLARRIRDWRGRTHETRRHQAVRHKNELEREGARSLPDDRSDLVVRVKSHETKPLFVEDAVGHMDLLGHDFFFFLDAESGQHNVVYRRKAGGYGLIQPAIEEFQPRTIPLEEEQETA